MSKLKFTPLPNKIPEPLCAFSGVYLPQFSSIYIQGGFGDSESKNIYSLNLETLQWNLRSIYSESLVGHSSIALEGRMLTFGGWNEKEYTNAMYFYDPLENSIRKSSTPASSNEWEFPAGRRDHSLTYAGDHIYLLGGWDSSKWTNASSGFSQLWKLTSAWKWEVCEVFGENPSTRRGHSTVYCAQLHELVVFGGIYGYTSLLGDLYVLDLKEMQWNKLNAADGPGKRAWHSAVSINNMMYVFGGLVDIKRTSNEMFQFDLVEKIWSCLDVELAPSPRYGALMLAVEGFLVILGGMGQSDEAFNDGAILDLDANYEAFRENAENFGVISFGSNAEVVPPPVPKELALARRFVRTSEFDPLCFK